MGSVFFRGMRAGGRGWDGWTVATLAEVGGGVAEATAAAAAAATVASAPTGSDPGRSGEVTAVWDDGRMRVAGP